MKIHGSTLSFPFRVDPQRGTLATIDDPVQIITESITSIVETFVYERKLLRDYGISDPLFTIVDVAFAAQMAFQLKLKIDRYEKLARNVRIEVLDGGDNRIALRVAFSVGWSNVPYNLVFPLWRRREELSQ